MSPFHVLRSCLPLVFSIGLACSSSSSGGGGGGGSGGAAGNGGGGSSCSCNITYNGVSQSIACGGSGCVNGATFNCDNQANATQGGACNSGAGGGGGGAGGGGAAGGGGGGGTTGCNLFTCTNQASCGNIAPCMSTSTGTNYCYEQEGSPSQCSSGTTATTGTVNGNQVTICVPPNCPQPVSWVQ